MKKQLLFLSIAFLLLRCQSSNQEAQSRRGPGDTMLEAVAAVYGGEVTSSGKEPDDGVFNIEISKSPVIEEQVDLTGMFASHIAWLSFKNLPGTAAPPQDIAVTVKLSTGESPVFEYSMRELESVKNALHVLEKTVSLLRAADYESLFKLHSPDRQLKMNREDLVRDCSSLDANNGRITDFKFQGFAFFTPSSGASELLHLAGLLKRERYDTPLSVIINPAAEATAAPVYQINFDY